MLYLIYKNSRKKGGGGGKRSAFKNVFSFWISQFFSAHSGHLRKYLGIFSVHSHPCPQNLARHWKSLQLWFLSASSKNKQKCIG